MNYFSIVYICIVCVCTIDKCSILNRALVKAAVLLLPLLGLTWLFGLLAVNDDTVVFAWIFTILNTLQVVIIQVSHMYIKYLIFHIFIGCIYYDILCNQK